MSKKGSVGLKTVALFFLFITFSSKAFATPQTETLVSNLNTSALLLFNSLEKKENSLISPLSIGSSSLISYVGAKGRTKTEIARSLGFTLHQNKVGQAFLPLLKDLTSSDQCTLINTLFIKETFPLLKTFQKSMKDDFHAQIQPLQSIDKMNAWISNQTENKIQNFFEPNSLSSLTKMILTNILLFKGEWKNPFSAEKTANLDFFSQDDVWTKTQMMQQTNMFPYFENKETQILALPLDKESAFALFIFLPKTPNKAPFNFYYKERNANFLEYFDRLQDKKVEVVIPKFHLNEKIDLVPLLKKLGIEKAFSNKANFSGITGAKNLYLSHAFHQSSISIDENGLDLQSASSFSFDLKGSLEMKNPIKFRANHPFMYVLVEMKSKLILLIGEYLTPKMGEEN